MRATHAYPLRPGAVLLVLLGLMIPCASPAVAQTQDQPAPAQPQSQAQPPLELVVGVVDFSGIMAESKAGKGLKAQADKQAAAFEAEYKKQGQAFSALEQQLEQQRPSLSSDDYKKKVTELNAQGKKMKDQLADKKQAIDGAFSKARDQLRNALLEVVADIAKKRGMTLVLDKNTVVLSAEGFDFSDEVLKRLNDKLPSVKM
jgi:outer membrane protein